MNEILQAKLDELNNAKDTECWYIVKQETNFFHSCYLVSFLKEYKNLEQKNLKLEDYVKQKANELNNKKGLNVTDVHRNLKTAESFGLIRKKSRKYEDAEISGVFDEINTKCNGIFENTELYKDIINKQIEKIFCGSVIDECYKGVRKDFRCFPVIFLYKILLELGKIYGKYELSMLEFNTLIITSKKYNDYLNTLFFIKLLREDNEAQKSFSKIKLKYTETCRIKNILEKNFDIFDFTNDKIILKSQKINEVSKKVYLYEQQLPNFDEDEYVDFLCSDKYLIDTTIPHPHNRILFGAPGTGKSYKLNKQSESFPETNIERVTFHPNYSYANFVGTYKPVQDSKNQNLDDTTKEILSIIEDKNKTSQEKYDLLKKYQNKDEIGATYLPNILGLSAIDDFTQVKSDGIEQDNFISRIKHGMKLRPFVNLKSLTDDSKIKYEYVPGPFMRTYAKAKLAEQNHTGEKFLLIIEEINRANVAAVFGDVFQLLDRKNKGDSEYPINASEDIKNFLIKEHKFTEEEVKTLSIPKNMYIWATMNSADQGVFPMDTAFKRRWEFEYIGIDDGADDKNNPDYKNYKIPLQIKRNEKNNSKEVLCYNWDLLRRKINESLLKNANYINEDKLLGPYFLNKTQLENIQNELKDNCEIEKIESFLKSFKSKVLMYLFEDVVKMRPQDFFDCQERSFSKICEKFNEEGLAVFKDIKEDETFKSESFSNKNVNDSSSIDSESSSE